MSGGLLEFQTKYGTEQSCILALSDLKWPTGFSCEKCGSVRAYHHQSRPRIYSCADCGHQHSVTAGTVFHKTKTPLPKWFLAAFLMAQDKRGVSAMFLSRQLGLRYETAWLMAQKLRHGLTDNPEFKLIDFIEIDETFYGGRRQKGRQGRAKAPGKSIVVLAVEKRATKRGRGIKGGNYVAGAARIAVVPSATTEQLGGFIRKNIAPKTKIISDGFSGYRNLDEFRHKPIVQGAGKNAEINQPIVHVLFSNIKAALNGTYHGVSAKHLPRYLREWEYRFNRRGNWPEMTDFVLRRAATRSTITYDELVAGSKPEGAH